MKPMKPSRFDRVLANALRSDFLFILSKLCAIVLHKAALLAAQVSQKTKQGRLFKRIAKRLKFSSTACALAGGIVLASNTPTSRFGFLLLALSSGQLLLASAADSDRAMTLYAASLFIFVDCLGVYRWLLH